MSVDAGAVLRCAAVIAEAAHGEANFRSAISRCYFAAFHAAYAWHAALPAPGYRGPRGPREAGRHETLVHQLYHPGLPAAHPFYWRSIALARMLNRGRQLRLLADYRTDVDIDRTQMAEALVNSLVIVRQCAAQPSQEVQCVTL
ncbi:hypothetical protein [Cupriavidus pauculus]|uniref:hypothetical protein n=1 Tax=Cupriavidus pauculus TaxID=82633 RepID=UPI003857D25E